MRDCEEVDKGRRRACGFCYGGKGYCCGGQSDGPLKCFLARLNTMEHFRLAAFYIDILSSRVWSTLSTMADCKRVPSPLPCRSLVCSPLHKYWLLSIFSSLISLKRLMSHEITLGTANERAECCQKGLVRSSLTSFPVAINKKEEVQTS